MYPNAYLSTPLRCLKVPPPPPIQKGGTCDRPFFVLAFMWLISVNAITPCLVSNPESKDISLHSALLTPHHQPIPPCSPLPKITNMHSLPLFCSKRATPPWANILASWAIYPCLPSLASLHVVLLPLPTTSFLPISNG